MTMTKTQSKRGRFYLAGGRLVSRYAADSEDLCGRLPAPLPRSVRPAGGWRRVSGHALLLAVHCSHGEACGYRMAADGSGYVPRTAPCPLCDAELERRACAAAGPSLLLWLPRGQDCTTWPTDCRRRCGPPVWPVPSVPRLWRSGETMVLVAHELACGSAAGPRAGVIAAWWPTFAGYDPTPADGAEKLQKLRERGIHVFTEQGCEPCTSPKTKPTPVKPRLF